MPPITPSPPRVIFDLDGVIARDDTMAVIVQRRLTSSAGRAIRGALPAAVWLLLRGLPSARIRMSRALGRVALSGLSPAEYRALAEQIGTELGGVPNWTIAKGLAAARRHLADGDEVIVTTGTEELLARAFLDAIGLPGISLVATTLGFDGRTVRYADHNMGPQKVANLDGEGGDIFYTDSDLDLPLAMLCGRTVLVNPDAHLARVFRKRITNLTIERWD
jgi:phosphatidylglycerophosphatase C